MVSRLRRAAGMTLLAAATSLLPAHAQSPAEQATTLTLETPRGRVTGQLLVPAAPTRPPVVVLVAAADGSALATALAAQGVASLRIDAPDSEETAALWIASLRNDERFPTVTVVGEGAALNAAMVAARAARADGVVTRGNTSAADAEIGRAHV